MASERTAKQLADDVIFRASEMERRAMELQKAKHYVEAATLELDKARYAHEDAVKALTEAAR